MHITCYEDWGRVPNRLALVLEAYSGSDIVQWYGNIERQVMNMIEDQESSRNHTYADKLREFLKVWRDNELTGSINIEQLAPLKAAASILAVDTWKLNDYFSSLSIQVKRIIASEEELPPLGAVPNNRGNRPTSDFGASHSAPASPSVKPEPEGAAGEEGAESEGEEDELKDKEKMKPEEGHEVGI